MNSTSNIRSASNGLSGWLVVLAVVWLGLGVRVVLALVHKESLAGDLALPAFAFFASSALLASLVYARLTARY